MITAKRIGEKAALMLATGFGLGLAPVASGTFGTILALPLVWFVWKWLNLGIGWQAGLGVVLSLVAIPVCGVAERQYGTKDDGRIVADEYMTFPLCMIGLPWNPWMVLVAFLSCRFFDIAKPAPADQLQRIKGGTGIVIDDVVASVYSLMFNHLVYWLVLHRFLASA
jgi:phosphatidylglycerophosphatase A